MKKKVLRMILEKLEKPIEYIPRPDEHAPRSEWEAYERAKGWR